MHLRNGKQWRDGMEQFPPYTCGGPLRAGRRPFTPQQDGYGQTHARGRPKHLPLGPPLRDGSEAFRPWRLGQRWRHGRERPWRRELGLSSRDGMGQCGPWLGGGRLKAGRIPFRALPSGFRWRAGAPAPKPPQLGGRLSKDGKGHPRHLQDGSRLTPWME
jgi:hypothetical protein